MSLSPIARAVADAQTPSGELSSVINPGFVMGIFFMVFGFCAETAKHRTIQDAIESENLRRCYGSMGDPPFV